MKSDQTIEQAAVGAAGASAGVALDANAAAGETPLRQKARRIVEAEWFRNAILGVIVFNAICLGLDTDEGVRSQYGPLLEAIDWVITVIFVVEIGLKLFAERKAFFKSGWNIFDFTIVGVTLLAGIGQMGSEISVLRVLRVMRVVRVFRVFRLFGVLPALRRVVDALFKAIPGISAIMAVLGLLFYVGAVMTTDLFGDEDPEHFGSIGNSMFTLFQVMTGDGWSDVVRPLLPAHPWAGWGFFIPFIVLSSFAVLNLFIAVIVEALQEGQAAEFEEKQEQLKTEISETREDIHDVEEAQTEIAEDIDEIEAAQRRAETERAQILESLNALRAEVTALRRDIGKA
jgi:voltage-gated sodium channel